MKQTKRHSVVSWKSNEEKDKIDESPSPSISTDHYDYGVNDKRYSIVSSSSRGVSLPLHHLPYRRESLIHRWTSHVDFSRSQSRKTSLTSEGLLSRIHGSQDLSSADSIVTPFAQILAAMKRLQMNFIRILPLKEINTNETNENIDHNGELSEEERHNLALETLKDLEWCMENLEGINSQRSVGDMASKKFMKIMSRELSQQVEKNASDSEISSYICTTFFEDQNNSNEQLMEEEILLPIEINSEKITIIPNKCRTNMPLTINIDGLNANNSTSGSAIHLNRDGTVPLYGVNTSHETELHQLFESSLNLWEIDIFQVSQLSNSHPLTAVTVAVFEEHNLLKTFNIHKKTLVEYLLALERNYYSDVPYHNSIHAADVTQSAHVLISLPSLQAVFTELEILAVLFASAIHDVNHPGVTNQYLVNSSDCLALLYNDSSVLENHHLAVAFTLLLDNSRDIFTALNKKQRQTLRRMVIDMVLATDMSKHMTLLASLKTLVETKRVANCGILSMDRYDDRLLILQNLVHCADLSNPTKPLPVYQQWIDRIMKEFFLQGDREKAANLDVSPMCDRNTAIIEKTQVSFIDYIVHPLWAIWAELVYPDVQNIFENLEKNREYFANLLESS